MAVGEGRRPQERHRVLGHVLRLQEAREHGVEVAVLLARLHAAERRSRRRRREGLAGHRAGPDQLPLVTR